jgi:hypothetical protein
MCAAVLPIPSLYLENSSAVKNSGLEGESGAIDMYVPYRICGGAYPRCMRLDRLGYMWISSTSTNINPQEDDHQDRRSIVLAPPSNRHMHILHNIYPLPASTSHIPQHQTPPPQPSVTQHKTRAYDLPYLAYPAFASPIHSRTTWAPRAARITFAPVTSAIVPMRRWRWKRCVWKRTAG